MARKKSIKSSAAWFNSRADETLAFITATAALSDEYVSWCHDYAVIRLYREFETLMLNCLIGALNNDTSTISEKSGYEFPKHLTDEVCEYLVIGGGYFDFRGRDGLIQKFKQFLPDTHYVIDIVKKPKYKESIEQLCALRNFAAHDSWKAKRAALTATGLERMSSVGAWIKRQDRFTDMANTIKELANEIHGSAPY